MKKKKILYIDMDNVLVDFKSGIDQLDEETKKRYDGTLDEVPGIFKLMRPLKDAVESFKNLNAGDFLVDDRQKNGAGDFSGELILFGEGEFPDWLSVKDYLLKKE